MGRRGVLVRRPVPAAAALLLVAAIALALAEIPRWDVCRGAYASDVCLAVSRDFAANNHVFPGPAWTGDPASALLHGAGVLLVAFVLHMLLAARMGRLWHGMLVGATAFCGVLTLVAGITGRGTVLNLPGEVIGMAVLPVVYFAAGLVVAAGETHSAQRWTVALLLLLGITSSPAAQILMAYGLGSPEDTPPWHGLVQAVPLALLAAGALAGAFWGRLRPGARGGRTFRSPAG